MAPNKLAGLQVLNRNADVAPVFQSVTTKLMSKSVLALSAT